MGCVFSKEAESSCKGVKGTSTSDRSIHRRFTIQINRSLKTTDGGYIAAIFSANYGILRSHAPVKAFDKKAFSQDPSQTENYPTHESCLMVKSNINTHMSLAADTVPMVGTKSASELLETQISIESTKDNIETINILELMEGLAEDEVSVNFKNLQEASNLLLPETKKESSTLVSCQQTDKVHTSGALSTNKIAKRTRPKSLSSISSIRSIEDVDMALSARGSKALPPMTNLREIWQQKKDIHAEKLSSVKKDILDTNIKPYDGNIDISIPECTRISNLEDLSIDNPEKLQRALSFSHMFKRSSSERKNSLDTNLDTLDICRSDSPVFATARFLYEAEGTSSPSSPELSAAASLKDWLPSNSHPSTPSNSLLCDRESSISGVLQFLQPACDAAEFHHASISKFSDSLCVNSVSNRRPGLQCQDGPELEDCGVPVFDPAMIDSFENALRYLSKEEWDAVRGMEDSPQDFLHLVKTLKKSRSNNVHSQNEKPANLDSYAMKLDNNAGTDSSKGSFESLKSRGSKSKFAEKKGSFMRQHSLELGKAVSQVRAKDEKSRAHVVLYSTTAQVGSKAYEDCSQVRTILQSLVGLCYDEKSVSELEEHKQELRDGLNISVAVVPTIYVKGRYLVGIDSIMHLYKKGLLGSMLREAGGL